MIRIVKGVEPYGSTPFIVFQKMGIKEDFQGLRNPRKRSFLDVNEYFKDEYNAENTFIHIFTHRIPLYNHPSQTHSLYPPQPPRQCGSPYANRPCRRDDYCDLP